MEKVQNNFYSIEHVAEQITNDEGFVSVLNTFKSSYTSGFKCKLSNNYKNGLLDVFYGITINGKLTQIIVTLFSTNITKTVSWHRLFLNDIKDALPEQFKSIPDHELIDMITCPVYRLDKTNGTVSFITVMTLSNWIKNGNKSKDGYNVYFYYDKLPNSKYCFVNKKQLNNHFFVTSIPHLTDKQLLAKCQEYAEKFHSKFADITQRSEKTKIKQITSGLYAEIKVYLDLLKNGHNVTLSWTTEKDDLGIDIQYHINPETFINLDVKSTSDDNLKITKKRQETDFYVVCKTDKNQVCIIGCLFKMQFWKSNITNSTAPTEIDGMFIKPLSDVKQHLVSYNDMYSVWNDYTKQKLKQKVRLFNND